MPERANPEKIMAEIPTPAQVALVRRRYVEGATLKSIVAETGVKSVHYFYRCLRGDLDDGSGAPLAPIPLRRAGVRIYGKNGSRRTIVARMWRTAERQVEEIEERLQLAGLDPGERESNARTLATLARTLRDLAAFDEARKPHKGKPQDKQNDEPVPRNIDDLRRSLARKLEAFVAGTANPVSGNVR
jgi:hypothetical protein